MENAIQSNESSEAKDSGLQVRNLKTSDFFVMAKIVSKMGTKVLKQLSESTTELQAGLLFVTIVLENAEADMKAWLADLAGKTAEEFDQLSFDAPIEVIEKLSEKEDLNAFFGRVRALVNKILSTR
jgi:hypothetical protein